VVDETSGACRSSEEPSIVHDANSDEDGGGDEKKKKAGTRCGRSQRQQLAELASQVSLVSVVTPWSRLRFQLSYLSIPIFLKHRIGH